MDTTTETALDTMQLTILKVLHDYFKGGARHIDGGHVRNQTSLSLEEFTDRIRQLADMGYVTYTPITYNPEGRLSIWRLLKINTRGPETIASDIRLTPAGEALVQAQSAGTQGS